MRAAFSLLELMIVIVILGVLAGLVLPNLLGSSEKAKAQLVCVQMKGIADSLQQFKIDNGVYPSTEEGLQALLSNPDKEAYPNYDEHGYFNGKSLPTDSWKNPFIYINEEGEFDLISLGADRKEGGEKDFRYSECKF